MFPTPYEYEAVIRLVVATILGLFIGFFRRGQPAGIRTIALICMGSTLFTIISFNPLISGGDPARIISQIVTGIGFIGAGVIWQSSRQVGGLTSAASIWIVAGIGINIGLGEWFLTTTTTLLAIGVLYSKHYIKRKNLE